MFGQNCTVEFFREVFVNDRLCKDINIFDVICAHFLVKRGNTLLDYFDLIAIDPFVDGYLPQQHKQAEGDE